jgi:hypothetical protein
VYKKQSYEATVTAASENKYFKHGFGQDDAKQSWKMLKLAVTRLHRHGVCLSRCHLFDL